MPTSEPRDSLRCVGGGAGGEREALVNAGEGTAYAALSGIERSALGRFGASSSDTFCSGVRVAPGWALTARHCAELPEAVFYGESGGKQRIHAWALHPEIDVALAHLESVDCESVLPLVDAEESPSTLSRATLAGYGLTGEGKRGRLEFLVEEVVSTAPEAVEVNGFGRSGACVGDSGGPLLVRDRAGRVAVLGVLSTGAASCVDIDHYLRVAPLLDWIRSNVELPVPPDECGAIDARGRCFDGQAVYCDEGHLRSDACGSGTSCGFLPSARGFRCAPQPSCTGDAFGFCQARAAIRCDEAGEILAQCDTLGQDCGYDAGSGVATCL